VSNLPLLLSGVVHASVIACYYIYFLINNLGPASNSVRFLVIFTIQRALSNKSLIC